MGHQCCSKQKVKRGLWSPEEDEKLIKFITTHGHSSWSSVPKLAGLQRCGKSCRLRWINYLRPDLKRGSFTAQEEMMIVDIHRILGNKWAQIAKHLPGRTDNEVKNFWNSCIKKKLIAQGLDPNTHNLLPPNYNKQTHHNNNINPCKPTSVFTISTTTTTSPNQDFFMDVKLPFYPPTSVPPPDVVNSSCPPSFHISSNQNPNPIGSVRTSCSTSFPSGFGIIDENCFWSDPIIQHEEKTNDFSTGKNSIDACFDQYSNFDFDFMDSTLMSSSPLDQLTWDSSHLLS